MLYGVFSDIHGNLHALLAVLKHFKKHGVKNHIFCGDFIGYGPRPNECIELIRSLDNLHFVTGNHDMAVANKVSLEIFNLHAALAAEITKTVIKKENLEFLKYSFPIVKSGKFMVMHGSPASLYEEYFTNIGQFKRYRDQLDKQVCFVGHSHAPFVMEWKHGQEPVKYTAKTGVKIKLHKNCRYVINPGSAGQPRDGDWRVSCGIYSPSANEFEFFRLEYPIEETQKEMEKTGMPSVLVKRVSLGV